MRSIFESFKGFVVTARFLLAWYVVGGCLLLTASALLSGAWALVPIWLFVADVAAGRGAEAERELAALGWVRRTPGMDWARTVHGRARRAS